jgi:hypothetical protein
VERDEREAHYITLLVQKLICITLKCSASAFNKHNYVSLYMAIRALVVVELRTPLSSLILVDISLLDVSYIPQAIRNHDTCLLGSKVDPPCSVYKLFGMGGIGGPFTTSCSMLTTIMSHNTPQITFSTRCKFFSFSLSHIQIFNPD